MQTFTKAERLCSKILIDKLVQTGKSFNSFPFRVVWLEITENIAPVQVVISVPKRIFKTAVDRNRLKRLIREAYRRNKELLYDQLNDKKILLMLIYTSKTKIEYHDMEEKLAETLERLFKNISHKT